MSVPISFPHTKNLEPRCVAPEILWTFHLENDSFYCFFVHFFHLSFSYLSHGGTLFHRFSSFSHRKRLNPLPPGTFSSERARTSRTSPHPFEIKCLTPFNSQHPSFSLWVALRLIACRSDPASGSVRTIAPVYSPEAIFGGSKVSSRICSAYEKNTRPILFDKFNCNAGVG